MDYSSLNPLSPSSYLSTLTYLLSPPPLPKEIHTLISFHLSRLSADQPHQISRLVSSIANSQALWKWENIDLELEEKEEKHGIALPGYAPNREKFLANAIEIFYSVGRGLIFHIRQIASPSGPSVQGTGTGDSWKIRRQLSKFLDAYFTSLKEVYPSAISDPTNNLLRGALVRLVMSSAALAALQVAKEEYENARSGSGKVKVPSSLSRKNNGSKDTSKEKGPATMWVMTRALLGRAADETITAFREVLELTEGGDRTSGQMDARIGRGGWAGPASREGELDLVCWLAGRVLPTVKEDKLQILADWPLISTLTSRITGLFCFGTLFDELNRDLINPPESSNRLIWNVPSPSFTLLCHLPTTPLFSLLGPNSRLLSILINLAQFPSSSDPFSPNNPLPDLLTTVLAQFHVLCERTQKTWTNTKWYKLTNEWNTVGTEKETATIPSSAGVSSQLTTNSKISLSSTPPSAEGQGQQQQPDVVEPLQLPWYLLKSLLFSVLTIFSPLPSVFSSIPSSVPRLQVASSRKTFTESTSMANSLLLPPLTHAFQSFSYLWFIARQFNNSGIQTNGSDIFAAFTSWCDSMTRIVVLEFDWRERKPLSLGFDNAIRRWKETMEGRRQCVITLLRGLEPFGPGEGYGGMLSSLAKGKERENSWVIDKVVLTRWTFYLDTLGEVVDVVPDNYLKGRVLIELVAPLLRCNLEETRDAANVLREAFEAAHSVMLAVFEGVGKDNCPQQRKDLAKELASWYCEIVLEVYHTSFKTSQIRLAYSTIVKSLSALDDALTWHCIQLLINKMNTLAPEETPSPSPVYSEKNSYRKQHEEQFEITRKPPPEALDTDIRAEQTEGSHQPSTKKSLSNLAKEHLRTQSAGIRADDDSKNGRMSLILTLIDQAAHVNLALFYTLLDVIEKLIRDEIAIDRELYRAGGKELKEELGKVLVEGMDGTKREWAVKWWLDVGQWLDVEEVN